MTIIVTLKRVLSVSAAVLVTSFATQAAHAQTMSTGLSPNDNMLAPANSHEIDAERAARQRISDARQSASG
jgi:Spy/CpxP family protein refolding chaperone